MLRHSVRFARALIGAIAVGLLAGGCGIKGPLVPAPAPATAAQPGTDSGTAAEPRKP